MPTTATYRAHQDHIDQQRWAVVLVTNIQADDDPDMYIDHTASLVDERPTRDAAIELAKTTPMSEHQFCRIDAGWWQLVEIDGNTRDVEWVDNEETTEVWVHRDGTVDLEI